MKRQDRLPAALLALLALLCLATGYAPLEIELNMAYGTLLSSAAHTWGIMPKQTAFILAIYGIVVSVRYLVFLLEVSE